MKHEKPKDIVRRLTLAGFEKLPQKRTSGSHTQWKCGTVKISVPTGHDKVSPGVVRKVNTAIEAVTI